MERLEDILDWVTKKKKKPDELTANSADLPAHRQTNTYTKAWRRPQAAVAKQVNIAGCLWAGLKLKLDIKNSINEILGWGESKFSQPFGNV